MDREQTRRGWLLDSKIMSIIATVLAKSKKLLRNYGHSYGPAVDSILSIGSRAYTHTQRQIQGPYKQCRQTQVLFACVQVAAIGLSLS